MIVLVTLLFATALLAAPEGELLLVDRIAAVVDDQVVTMRQLFGQLPPGQHSPEVRDRKLREVLDLMIEEKLLNREVFAMRDQLGVTEADVDRAIDEIQRLNRLTRDQLRDTLYRQGMSWSEYRKKLREQIERMRLIQLKVGSRIVISEQQVKAACMAESGSGQVDAVHLSHILIEVPLEADPAAAQQAEEKARYVRQQLDRGSAFADLVERYSADTRAPDGDLGTFKRGQLFEEIEAVAFRMRPDEISQPLRSPLGWHIIKLIRQVTASEGKCSDPTQLAGIHQRLYQEESKRQMQAWVEQLKQKVYLEIRL